MSLVGKKTLNSKWYAIIDKNGEPIVNKEQQVLLFDDRELAKAYVGKKLPDGVYEYLESCGRCVRCGAPIFPSVNPKYDLQCFSCDEDFFSFEQPFNTLQSSYTLQWLYEAIRDLVRRGYGNMPVIYRDDTEPDMDIVDVYVDDEADRVVLRGV